tara:strand:- start:818 stop:1084 length:267 start_codon:yes stop_codon:yes gene_type:complete
MKVSESKKTRMWLKNNGFTSGEIFDVEKLYNKEGIKFCIKSFRIDELKYLKMKIIDLKKHEEELYYKELLESVEGVDIESAINKLIDH